MRTRPQTNLAVLSKTLCIGLLALGICTACVFDEVPSCPGQCFDFTLERGSPIPCHDAGGAPHDISFTGTDGYRGRTCFNSPSVPLVAAAIEHLRAGGRLADLSMEVVSAYTSTVNTVRADLEAECFLAAPGQCTNAVEVCSVVGAQAYQQLVVDEACTLGLDGTEPVTLAAGQTCELLVADGSGSDGSDPHCIETTAVDGLDDDTGSSGLADDTTT